MKALVINQLGAIDNLRLKDVPEPTTSVGERRVRVEAAGINFADITSALGKYPGGPQPPYIAGREFAGVVEDTGERVMGYTQQGAFAETVVVRPEQLWPQPQGWTSAQSAAFPVNFMTAWLVYWKAGLTPGAYEPAAPVKGPRRALIHAVAGGVGTAAVQIGRLLGIETYGTSSSDEKLARAERLGLTHAINYSRDDYQQKVLEWSNGEGVDCVFEMLGGEHTKRSTRCCRPFGRVILYGTATGERPQFDTLAMYRNGVSVHGLWLSELAKDAQLMADAWSRLQPWVQQGKLQPEIGHQLPLSQAASAFELLLARKNYGKVVLTI